MQIALGAGLALAAGLRGSRGRIRGSAQALAVALVAWTVVGLATMGAYRLPLP